MLEDTTLMAVSYLRWLGIDTKKIKMSNHRETNNFIWFHCRESGAELIIKKTFPYKLFVWWKNL